RSVLCSEDFSKRTLWHFASCIGRLECLCLFGLFAKRKNLQVTPFLNAQDRFGFSPLHLGVKDGGSAECVLWLLMNGADKTATTSDGKTALDLLKDWQECDFTRMSTLILSGGVEEKCMKRLKETEASVNTLLERILDQQRRLGKKNKPKSTTPRSHGKKDDKKHGSEEKIVVKKKSKKTVKSPREKLEKKEG